MSDEWATPPKAYSWLDVYCGFRFNIDLAATKENALCAEYYTKEDSALDKVFLKGSIFCNPPYSLDKEFAELAKYLSPKKAAFLMPVRSDRIWFQHWLHDENWKQCWITGRLHFGGAGKGAVMYNVIFYRGAELPKFIDASWFNDNGKGGATK